MSIVFDDITLDIKADKKLRPKPNVTELLLRGRKPNFVFLSQSYFKVLKTIRWLTTHYFLMKIPNKRELQQIVSNYLSDNEIKGFMKLEKEYNKE